MGEDIAGFAARVRAAMQQKGWPERPSELMVRFNSRYPGRSVTFQTVSGWLRGASRPREDKLETLALVLGVTPGYLLFGPPRARGIGDAASAADVGVSPEHAAAWADFLAFPPEEQRYVLATIEYVRRSLKR